MRMQQQPGPSGVLLKGPLKELPCTDLRVECGLPEEIEGEFSLWEQEVPKVRWNGRINASQDCQEVVLECGNGVLHSIAAMHVWRDKLEGGILLKGDGIFLSRAGFVIRDLEIHGEPTGCQASHDSVVGGNAVAVLAGNVDIFDVFKRLILKTSLCVVPTCRPNMLKCHQHCNFWLFFFTSYVMSCC
jgi:hypothetical protein